MLVCYTLHRLRAATQFIMQSEKLAAASFLRDLSRKDVIRNDLSASVDLQDPSVPATDN